MNEIEYKPQANWTRSASNNPLSSQAHSPLTFFRCSVVLPNPSRPPVSTPAIVALGIHSEYNPTLILCSYASVFLPNRVPTQLRCYHPEPCDTQGHQGFVPGFHRKDGEHNLYILLYAALPNTLFQGHIPCQGGYCVWNQHGRRCLTKESRANTPWLARLWLRKRGKASFLYTLSLLSLQLTMSLSR